MSEYFTDETDPTIGKLYINYPMMESFRDCDDFFDPCYSKRNISINEDHYVRAIANRKLCPIHLKDLSGDQFKLLMLQNIYKANEIVSSKWEKPVYRDYLQKITTTNILLNEYELAEKDEIISVLNSALLLVVDYYGNDNGFYDGLTNEPI